MTATKTVKPDTKHAWIAGAVLDISEKQARRAVKYGSYMTASETHVEALDVYCRGCRQQFTHELVNLACPAKVDNRHLIGGDQRVRAKRKAIDIRPGMAMVPGPHVTRFGIQTVDPELDAEA